MAIMLPDSLIWIMDKLGLDWPDINEDELHKAADILRTFRDDFEALIQKADSQLVVELAPGFQSRAGEAYISSWNTQRSQNLQQVLDAFDPITKGIDIGGDVVFGLKMKVIAQIAQDCVTLVGLFALGPLGAAGAAAKIVATKIAFGIMVDIAVAAAIDAIDDPVIHMLQEKIPALVRMVLDHPIVEDTGAELNAIAVDLEALDQADADMNQQAGDVEVLVTQLISDLVALHITE